MAEADCDLVVGDDLGGGNGCVQCPAHGTCDRESSPGAPSPEEDEGTLRGWSFAGAAAGYFLVPLVLACVGAAVGGSQLGQFIGAAAGFGSGMAVTTAVANRRRASEEAAWWQR